MARGVGVEQLSLRVPLAPVLFGQIASYQLVGTLAAGGWLYGKCKEVGRTSLGDCRGRLTGPGWVGAGRGAIRQGGLLRPTVLVFRGKVIYRGRNGIGGRLG
jgi:hypothetical protein